MILDDSFDLLLTPNSKQDEMETIKVPTVPCRQQYLLKSNFLSEFLTKSEKQKVLQNLGINELAGGGSWGSIQGTIKDQLDLIDYISNPVNIKYKSVDNPTITNLKEALDSMLYTPLIISLSVSPNLAELGTTIKQVNISWKYNKKSIVSQTINTIPIPNSKRSYVMQGNFNTNQTFTLKVIDSAKNYTASTILEFVPAIYYGDSLETPTLPLTDKLLSKNRYCNITINAKNYIYIFIPNKYGTPNFSVGGFEGGFQKVGSCIYNTTNYNIWRSDNTNLGQTTVTIK